MEIKYETVLPENFDGTFRFTNWTDEDFVGRWGNVDYTFPAQTTSPMIMPQFTALETQNIRKKFAKDLGEREFFKSQKYKELVAIERTPDGMARANSIHGGNAYNESDLASYIQRCLEPLTAGQAFVQTVETTPIETKLKRDDEGEIVTVAIDRKTSLRKKALEA